MANDRAATPRFHRAATPWICSGALRYQVPMNRKQRRAHGRPGDQGQNLRRPPRAIAGWFAAALAHQRAGRAAKAERGCRLILSVDPGHAPTLHLLGLIEHQQGRSGDAIEHIRAAIARDAGDPAFHHNLGNILRAQDLRAEAIECYERALALAPTSVDTLYNLGNTCQELGRPEQAIAYFERALRLRPDAIELHNNLGTALQDAGRIDEAIASYRKALGLRPDAAETFDNLAGALRAQGRLDSAQAIYESVLVRAPDRVESHIGLGLVLRDRGRLDEAIFRYEHALALAPDHPAAHNNIGVALVELGRPEEAIEHYRRALMVQPDRAETHNNLGIALERRGRYPEALGCYGRALTLKPDYAEAHFNRSHALLVTGELDEGWREYEWRFAVARYDRNFGRPLWSGEPLGAKTILIHAEQGFGDTLQFVRYVPAVAERGGRVVLEAPGPLVRLLGTLDGASRVVAAGDPLPEFDCHCPLLSLPRIFETNLTTIPDAVPYLNVPAEASVAWPGRIGGGSGLRVGLVWAGATQTGIDLQSLQPLSGVAGVNWFSLQVGDRSRDLSLVDRSGITDLSPWLADFADTAAAVCQLDLVISVDTSVAHLAGALARPTWVVLPSNPDWRWLLDRDDSPWYPTARLFRQKTPGNWTGVINDLRAALAWVAG
jgi:tetratricopeptide (TPR) repeat protein